MDIVTLRAWLHLSKKPQAWFAKEVGISPQAFSQTLKHGGPRAVSNLGERLRPILETLVPYSQVTFYLGSEPLNRDGTSGPDSANLTSIGRLKALETALRSALELVEALLRVSPLGPTSLAPPANSPETPTQPEPVTQKPTKYIPKLRFLDEPRLYPRPRNRNPLQRQRTPKLATMPLSWSVTRPWPRTRSWMGISESDSPPAPNPGPQARSSRTCP